MPAFVIHDPSLVVLIGAAGSGKSTLATRLFRADEVLSSDALRAVVSGDEADQGATRVAFKILHQTVARRLATGRLTVVDATNATPSDRRPFVSRARAAAVPVVAIVLDLEGPTVHDQNARRSRVVSGAVIERHLDAVRKTVDGDQLATEGFDQVILLRTPAEAAALSIERRAD
jgi:protein phosphatase